MWERAIKDRGVNPSLFIVGIAGKDIKPPGTSYARVQISHSANQGVFYFKKLLILAQRHLHHRIIEIGQFLSS